MFIEAATSQFSLRPDLNGEHSTPPDLTFDGEEPLENNPQHIAINVLIDSALTTLADQPNSFVSSNIFICYSKDQAINQDFQNLTLSLPPM